MTKQKSSPSVLSKEDRQKIREWARKKGYKVGVKGVISQRIVDEYRGKAS